MFAFKTKAPRELVDMGIAPIRPDHWLQEPLRLSLPVVEGKELSPPPEPLSKRQKKKARKEKAKQSICYNFAKNACQYGDDCRFNHDLEFWVSQRRQDLPGSCPYANQNKCPFGMMCRWAASHSQPDSRHKRETAPPAEIPQTVHQNKGTFGTLQLPSPALGTTEEAPQTIASLSADASETSHPGLTARQGDEEMEDGTRILDAKQPETNGVHANGNPSMFHQSSFLQKEAMMNRTGSASPSGRGGPQRAGDSTIPPGIIELPVLPREQPSTNVLDKNLQQALWKRTYNFDRANKLVTALGGQAALKLPKGQASNSPQVNGAVATDVNSISSKDAEGVCRHPADGTSAVETFQNIANHQKTGGSAGQLAGGEIAAERQADASVGPENGDGTALVADEQTVSAVERGEGHAQSKGQDQEDSQPSTVPVFDVRHQWAAMHSETPLKAGEKRSLDFRGKLYLAPLTTVGNLPFRRVCKALGADITCGEMALATCLLQGQTSEWALLRRHPCEDMFGVQVCGSHANAMVRCAQLLEEKIEIDFVDINMGCPIDLICSKGAGSALLQKPQRMEQIVRGMSASLSCPLTIKVRRGYFDNQDLAHSILPKAAQWGAAAATLHGRSREQRYTKSADWGYIAKCAAAASPLPLIGNGDIFSYADYEERMRQCPQLATTMLARGALIKPWLFTEIKEQRVWDISAGERMDLLKQFCSAGLLHWGSDEKGVETTRRFLLEWMSFLWRYIPVALLEVLPQKMNWRPPFYYGRSDLETLLASPDPSSWVAISEMLLGPTPAGFTFTPKHKSNAYTSGAKPTPGEPEDEENG